MTWSQPSSAGHTCSLLGAGRGKMCMHKLEAIFSQWASCPLHTAGPGASSSSGSSRLQEMLGWFHPGFLSHGCPLDYFF